MKRYLCCLAVLGVVALPDWASAFHPCGAPPWQGRVGPPPVAYTRPLVFVQPCAPVYEVPLPPPCYYPVPVQAVAIAPRPAAPIATSPTPKPVAVRPDTPPTRPPVIETPKWEGIKPAGATTPKGEPGIPAPQPPVPATPPKTDDSPSITLPPLPESDGPLAPLVTPTPAPPPADPGSALPPPLTSIPGLTEPAKTDRPADEDALPPLVLPPEGLGPPTGIVPLESMSRSSPLASGVTVRVFTVAGDMPAAATRRVGFFNHTGNDIALVIAGRKTTLPKMTYIHATVPPSFAWHPVGGEARTAVVPDGAPGLDIVFRE